MASVPKTTIASLKKGRMTLVTMASVQTSHYITRRKGHIYATASLPKGRTRAATPRTGSGVLQSNSSLTDMPAVPQSRLSSAVTAMRRCC